MKEIKDNTNRNIWRVPGGKELILLKLLHIAQSSYILLKANYRFNAIPWKESYDQLRQHIKKQRHYFANKGPSSQG